MEFCSMLGGSLDGRGLGVRMDTCICMTEFLCYPPETITTLLISYTPIQNKKLTDNSNKTLVSQYHCPYPADDGHVQRP